MKKIVILILSVLYFNLYAQVTEGWNPVIVTGIPYVNLEPKQIATFANKDGIHVLTSLADGSQAVKYFRIKSDGTFPSGFPSEGIQLDASGNLPTITGDENFIYAVFHKVSNGVHTVELRKSTDGINWDLIPSLDFQSDIGCNGVDATYNSANGLHVTWSEKLSTINYKSYYNIYVDNGWAFSTNQVVTNISPINNGGMPTVTTSIYNSTARVHFSVNTGTGQNLTDNRGNNYSRDYRYTAWDSGVFIKIGKKIELKEGI